MVTKVEVFTSPTCPHCPGAERIVKQAKEELGDAIDVMIIDISDNDGRKKAIDYGIMAVPAIAINNVVEFVGAPTYPELMAKLQ